MKILLVDIDSKIANLALMKVYPYVMPYNNTKDDPWIRAFARYVNRPALFKNVEWRDFHNPPGTTPDPADGGGLK